MLRKKLIAHQRWVKLFDSRVEAGGKGYLEQSRTNHVYPRHGQIALFPWDQFSMAKLDVMNSQIALKLE